MVLNNSTEADSDLLSMSTVAESLPEMDAKSQTTVATAATSIPEEKLNVKDGSVSF